MNIDFSKLHILLQMELHNLDVSKGFQTKIKESILQDYRKLLDQIEIGIHDVLKGNFLITKNLSEYLQENKTLVDPILQKKYITAFATATDTYTKPPLSPISDVSSRVSSSDVSETASDTDDSDSEHTNRKKNKP